MDLMSLTLICCLVHSNRVNKKSRDSANCQKHLHSGHSYSDINTNLIAQHIKALVFLYALDELVECHLLSSFCDDSNLHISLFKYVLSTMGVSKESISKFLIGNRFHVKLRILSPENCKQSLRVKS